MNKVSPQIQQTIGYKDADYGIRTFPASGTDNYPTVRHWVQRMREVVKKCGDKQYAAGVTARLDEWDAVNKE